MNQFGDLKSHEFVLQMKQQISPSKKNKQTTFPSKEILIQNTKVGDMPDSLDWRSLGIVPNVINQGQCTSSIFFC